MTQIEKQFFETFNLIKYKLISKYDKRITYGPFDSLEDINLIVKGSMRGFIIEEVYPQIIDRILLELIGILAKQGIYLEDMDGLFKMKTYETSMVMQNADNLKDVILKTAETACRLSKNDGFKQQVQAIFSERI